MLNNLKSCIIVFFILLSQDLIFSQEQMHVKPADFNPQKVFINYYSGKYQTPGGYSLTDGAVVTRYPNIRVFQSPYNQSEPVITISPSDANKIFIGANTDYGMGYYYSLNGGTNWSGGDILPGSVYYSTNPYAAYNNTGTIIYNYLENLIITDRSVNGGISWLGRIVIPSTSQFDMNSLAVDVKFTSPYYGKIYAAWSDFTMNQPTIVFSVSTDNGNSFTAPIQVGSPQSGHYEQGCKLAAGPNGEIYCVWATPNISNSNIEDKIGFTKSTNGGSNWSAPSLPLSINGIRGTLLYTGIRVNSFPSLAVDISGGARNGYLYVCWAQRNLTPAGSDADICFSSSSNGGSSWSTPVRVNDDPLNNGKQQYLPWITVDQSNGKIAIIYYDNRDPFMIDSANVYLAVSADGGSSFTNIKVSDHSHYPVPLQGYSDGYFSDYIGVAAANDIVYPVWTDNRNGNAQIYSAKVVLSPYIVHTPVKDSENLNGPYVLSAKIYSFGSGINSSETKIIWGRGGLTDSLLLTQGSGNNWSANISGNGSSAQYRYFIKTKDNAGKESRLPVNAPSEYFTFNAGADLTNPVIIHTPQNIVSYRYWPDTLTAIVSDNKGIDSVWVRWYVNSTSTGIKHFRLQNISDDNYSGIFNSTQSQVNPEDTVFYRIFAMDNSVSHNVDSTSLYYIHLFRLYFVSVGNGQLNASYPFRTFYMDSRTQMLYLASEISAAGGTAPSRIMAIAYDVLYASPQMMNGLTVRMQLTNNSTLTGFVSTGWTTTYTGNLAITGTGLRYFDVLTPFFWDGTSNILVEVCYNNNSFGSNSNVSATSTPGKTWHQYQDLVSGSGCTDLTSGSAQNNRPNLGILFNSVLGAEEPGNTIPSEYSLKQNYPNPFNPVTRISYSIPVKSFVTVKIFDILGREIQTLVNDSRLPGNYSVEFNGSGLPSGVYFYHLSAGTYSETKKMILVK